MDNNILIATWLLCLSLLLLPSPGCFGQELPLINGTSIVLLDNKGASPNEPTNIAISWSFTFDIFVKDADDFVNACHGYCTGVDFDRLYNRSSRACKYMLVSNVLQYIESNSEYDGLYDLQAMQRLKTDTEIIETKEQESKSETESNSESIPKLVIPEFVGIQYRLSDNWYGYVNIDDYKNKAINYLEIGVLYGANIISVAKTYGLHNDSKIYCIDPWEDYHDYSEYKNSLSSVYDSFIYNIESSGVKNKMIISRGYSNVEIQKFQDNFFDIIYIDGNHEPEYVLEDAVLSFRKLKYNGIMIFDDYGWGGPDVTQRGIDAFLAGYRNRILVLGMQWSQVFIKKIESSIDKTNISRNFDTDSEHINGTSIVLLDNKGASPNEPTNIAISWSFTFDIFVKDADDFVNACHGYCTGVDFDRLYHRSSRACKYMLVSNVLQYIESNSEYDGLYDLQAMQRLKTDTEIIETKEQETKAEEIKEQDRLQEIKAEEIKEQDRLRLAKYLSLLEEDTSTSRTTMMISNNGASSDIYEMNTNQKVALIVPSTSKRYKSVDELPLLLYFMKSLDNTLAAFDTMSVVLYLGYDEGDAMYDNEVTMNEIVSTIQQRAPSLLIKPVRLSGFEGKVVHIWNGLTRIAYDDSCEYYFLLGDDVLISTFNWIPRMINILRYESKLLQNFGTVAFYDLLIPHFPTFPVFHSTHLMIFGIETAFDPYFINSYADPWISDIYESFNSSFIAKNVKLYNAVGGDWRTTSPRYVPTDVHMEDYIDKVQRARRRIAQWVGLKTPIKWNPSTLAYMEEGIFYAYFCNGSIGCKGKIEESPKQFTEYRNNLVE